MSKTTITVCTTCKREDASAAPPLSDAPAQPVPGETLLAHVQRAAEGREDVAVRGVACLMGCARGCNAAISADGKMTYVLGQFEPDAEAAAALVEYAGKHAFSETGAVPYREWPQGVKGHFQARIPPLDRDDA